jgi:hypothetical protein
MITHLTSSGENPSAFDLGADLVFRRHPLSYAELEVRLPARNVAWVSD